MLHLVIEACMDLVYMAFQRYSCQILARGIHHVSKFWADHTERHKDRRTGVDIR